jgi:hypothetical protein
MTTEIRPSIKQVENGYIVTITYDGNEFGDYKSFTVIYSDINEAFTFIKKALDKTQIEFSTRREDNSL